MKESSIPSRLVAAGIETAWEAVSASFERFCLTTGIATLTEMMQQDVVELCGARYARSSDRRGYRWGHTAGKIGFRGGRPPPLLVAAGEGQHTPGTASNFVVAGALGLPDGISALVAG